jgi:hypothetical protein
MNSSEEMLEALISRARIINPGYMSRPILRSPTDSDSDSDSEDSKVVDLETVWAKLGLGKGKKHGLIEEANWYKKSLVDKTEAKPKPKPTAEGDGKAKAEPKTEAKAEPKAKGDGEDDDTVFASAAPVKVASASATPTAKADDKGKKEDGDDDEESMGLDLFGGKGGASLLDAIQYEQNRLNSVNQMIGGKYY